MLPNSSVIALLERQQEAFNQSLADYYQHMRQRHQQEQQRLNTILYTGSHDATTGSPTTSHSTDNLAMETDCMSAAAAPQRWPLHQIQEHNSQPEPMAIQQFYQNSSKRQLTDETDSTHAKRARN